MTKEEIKDFLDVSEEKEVIDFIFKNLQENERYKLALEISRKIIIDSVSKERYNNLAKKYNKLIKKGK